MSRYDYDIAKELIKADNISFNSLIMAAIVKAPEHYRLFRENFPDICREYFDRDYGVDGFLRGESLEADKVYKERDLEGLYAAVRTDNGRRRTKHGKAV